MHYVWKRAALLLFVLVALLNPLAVGHDAMAAGTGTLRLTLRGCPDGVDPTTITESLARRECDTPLDAPDDAFIYYGGDGQGGEEVRYLDRAYDGTYKARVPANTTVNLIGFEPTVRDSYAMTNVRDRDDDGNFDVRVQRNRTLTVRVYYYNAPGSSGGSASATLNMTFRACPDDVNANNVNPFEVCTIPLDAPDASLIVWDQEGGVSIADIPRQYDGTYEFSTPRGILNVALIDIAPIVRNAYVIYGADLQLDGDAWGIYLTPGEDRDIWVFYYYG